MLLLKKVMRQLEEKSITQILMTLRKDIELMSRSFVNIWVPPGDELTTVHSKEKLMVKEYVKQIKKTGIENSIYICHTNRKANEINRMARQLLFPQKPWIQKGELLVVIRNNLKHGLTNGEQVEVMEISDKVTKRAGLQFRDIKAKTLDEKGGRLIPGAKIILWREARTRPMPGLTVDGLYRVRIDGAGKEVQLYPLEKTLFIFFLRHSEGMPLSRLREHRQVLMGIYQKLSNQSGLDGIERSINNLVDTKSNAVYEKLSRIKREMVRLLGKQSALEYYITGRRGETHRISLPQHLVKWKNNGEAENRTE
jgi:hypothetical protein